MTNILLSLDLISLMNSYNVLLSFLTELCFFLNVINSASLTISALSFLDAYVIILRELLYIHFFRLYVRLIVSYMK